MDLEPITEPRISLGRDAVFFSDAARVNGVEFILRSFAAEKITDTNE
jgi:hypothetical protein